MKQSREVLKRLASAEKKLDGIKQSMLVWKDPDGYWISSDEKVSQAQFDLWKKQQEAQGFQIDLIGWESSFEEEKQS